MTRRPLTLEDAGMAIVLRLRQYGHEAFWAGGCVRDKLLKSEPVDIDVATDAPPEVIVKLFSRTRKVGAQFGVVLVRQGEYWIETATFRTDVDYQDGRRPERVVFTTAEEDAKRRDFTINGLFYDPIDDRVIDYVGGQDDLEARVIRAIGDPAERFTEDHLRMLRAVRFATRLGFRIDGLTADAIHQHAGKITRISPERIREELDKMFAYPSRAQSLEKMAELSLLKHLWPGADWPTDRIERAVRVLAALPEDADFTLSLAALLIENSPADADHVGVNLRCSNVQIDHMRWLLANCDRLDEVESLSLAAFKKLIAHDRFDDLLALHGAVLKSKGRSFDANDTARQRRDSIPANEVAPPPFVTGLDLIELGLEPGPRFKAILDELYDAQLNNELTIREQALERLEQMA